MGLNCPEIHFLHHLRVDVLTPAVSVLVFVFVWICSFDQVTKQLLIFELLSIPLCLFSLNSLICLYLPFCLSIFKFLVAINLSPTSSLLLYAYLFVVTPLNLLNPSTSYVSTSFLFVLFTSLPHHSFNVLSPPTSIQHLFLTLLFLPPSNIFFCLFSASFPGSFQFLFLPPFNFFFCLLSISFSATFQLLFLVPFSFLFCLLSASYSAFYLLLFFFRSPSWFF